MRRLTFLLLCLFIGMGLSAQTRVSGTVFSAEDGEPVIGASVVVKGTTTGTVTDYDGKFQLTTPAGARTLVFSFMGMETQEHEIRPTMVVRLASDSKVIDEVMVVAYGTAKKSSFTGSASRIKGDEIAKIQTSSVTSALEGKTAGVQLVSSTGQPGENPTVRIRGIGSINASKAPLYVVDGAFYDGPISAINSSDIESMTVLKDAAANSLYGARGANGVILITTKRKNSSSLGIQVDAKWGVNTRGVPDYDVISNQGTYYEQTWKGQYNRLAAAGLDQASIISQLNGNGANSLRTILGGYNNYNVSWDQLIDPTTGKLNSSAQLLYTDRWEDALFSSALRQEYNLSMGGGDDKHSYYVGLGYLDDNSYAKSSAFQRITGRLRYERQVAKWLKFGANLAYAQTTQDYPNTSGSSYMNFFQWTRMIAPIYPVFLRDPSTGAIINDADGKPRYDYGDASEYGYSRPYAATANPAGALNYDINETVLDNITGGTFMNINFYDDLMLRVAGDVTNTASTYTRVQNPLYGDAQSFNGRVVKTHQKTLSTTGSAFLNYNKSLDKLSIDAMAGTEVYNRQYEYFSGTKSNMATSDGADLDNAVVYESLSSYTQEYSVIGILGRVNLEWDNKYYLSGSFRRDASSRFAKDNRWGNFGSVGASWRISQMGFMDYAKKVDNLTLKASVGTQGNDGLLYSDGSQNMKPYLDQFAVTNNNGDVSLSQTYIGNPDITWEKSLNVNAGIDARFFDRLNVGAEFFYKKTTDMLFMKPLPVSTGFASYPENLGAMQNIGVEFEFDVDIVRTRDWNFNVGINMTHVKNKVLTLPAENRESGIFSSGYTKMVEGGSLYDIYLPVFAGLNENGKATWNLYDADGNVTGVTTNNPDAYTATNRRKVGTALADLFGGVNLSASYKGFDLSTVFSYQIGGKVFDSVYQSTMQMRESGRSMHKDLLNAWTPQNTNTSVPVFELGDNQANGASDYFLTSASYFNIRNISLGYTIPKSFANKMQISSLRLYAVADNVALFSARKGLDPRQYDYGTSGFNYSPIRSISFGINLTL